MKLYVYQISSPNTISKYYKKCISRRERINMEHTIVTDIHIINTNTDS